MANGDTAELTGLEKASILLIAMGTEVAAEVFKHLTEPEIERLSAQIIRMQYVDQGVIDAVVAEFEQVRGRVRGTRGGKNFAAQVLEQVVGGEKASELLNRAAIPGYGRPFGSLWDLDVDQLSRILAREHPQVIALVLAHLPPEKAAAILCECSEETQAEVAHRICTMDSIEPDIMRAVEDALQTRLTSGADVSTESGGPKILVEILNSATRATERNVLDSLTSRDPAVGEQVRSLLFVFEDMPKLEDRTIQSVLREVEQEDLRLALKGASDEIKEIIFKNMSERAADMLKEDLELLSHVRAKDVEAAQQKLVYVVRRLLASGEAVLKGAEPEEEQIIEQFDQAQSAA